MFKKVSITILALICIAMLVIACGKDKSSETNTNTETDTNAINIEKSLEALENFDFNSADYSGYAYTHTQTIAGKVTNERTVELTITGENKGVLVEANKSLNPDLTGEEYLTDAVTITFDGDNIKKNGVATTDYTASGLSSFELFKVSAISSKLTDTKFENDTLSFTIPKNYAGAIMHDINGITDVKVEIVTDSNIEKLVSVSLEYERNGVLTQVEVEFN